MTLKKTDRLGALHACCILSSESNSEAARTDVGFVRRLSSRQCATRSDGRAARILSILRTSSTSLRS